MAYQFPFPPMGLTVLASGYAFKSAKAVRTQQIRRNNVARESDSVDWRP